MSEFTPFVTARIYLSLIYNDIQTKTKAKKRYLKAKRERRKQRKIHTRDGGLPEEETGDNPDDVPSETISTVIDPAQPAEQPRFVTEDGSKKKKRKLAHSTAEGSADDQPQPVRTDEPNLMDEPGSSRTLPRFPLPTRPDAPSKTELALQGLDRAQIEAELVDPNSTLPIDLGADNNRTALGLKTRKRLIDLGVNELFAGISHYFPHSLFPTAKVEQFRRQLFRFCFDPDTNTPVFMTHITRHGICVFRLLLVAGRRSHMHCR